MLKNGLNTFSYSGTQNNKKTKGKSFIGTIADAVEDTATAAAKAVTNSISLPDLKTSGKKHTVDSGIIPSVVSSAKTAVERQGQAIKSTIKNVLSKKYGELDTRHLFDDIDDKDIEDNIETAENAIKTNIDRGTLSKSTLPKLPNLRDGLALSYAAANKGNSKAATKAREAAYMETEPLVKETDSRLLYNSLAKKNNANAENTAKNEIKPPETSLYSNRSKENLPKNGVRFKAETSGNTTTNKIEPDIDSIAKKILPENSMAAELQRREKEKKQQFNNMTDEQEEIYESRKIIENKNIFDKEFWDALYLYHDKVIKPDINRKANDWVFAPILEKIGNLNADVNNYIENNNNANKLLNLIFNSGSEYSPGDPDENYNYNKTIDLYKTGATSGAFINNQSKLGNIKFGIENINYGGCGLIAMYNVMHGVGKPLEFADLIYDNEKSAILKGGLGVYPTSISEYLKSKDLKVLTDFIGVDENYNTSNCDAVIHLYFRKDGTAHYVAGISDGEGKFRFYNSDTKSTLAKTWEEYFEETLESNKENPVIYSSAFRIQK